ncbi:hypothetical protein SeLEV6574_g00422 [Synchytrium endobioticum]|nr:hypothetical protein SeLEV6574_g00422 [Synchytrium endobioticum]
MSQVPLTPREAAEISLIVSPAMYAAWCLYEAQGGFHSAHAWGLVMSCLLAVENQWRKHLPWGTTIGAYRPSPDQGITVGCLLAPLTASSLLIANMANSYTQRALTHTATLSISCALASNVLLVPATNKVDIKKAVIVGLVILRMYQQSGLAYYLAGPSMGLFAVLYYCILAVLRKSFTAGEAMIVCHLFAFVCIASVLASVSEHYNMLSLKFTPLFVYLLALIAGMLVIGILANTILIHAKSAYTDMVKGGGGTPETRLQYSYRIWISLAFGTAALLIVLFCIAPLVQARINQDPFRWVLQFILQSGRKRVAVLVYLGLVVALGVTYAVQRFDAARPRNAGSINAKRKYFHFLAFGMFSVSYALDPDLLFLAFSFVTSLFIMLEYCRFFRLAPIGDRLHSYLSQFSNDKDAGPAVLSHLYLLVGCALPVWLSSVNGRYGFGGFLGIVTLGLGDSLASVVGIKYGRRRWPHSRKTLEGTAVFVLSVLVCWVVGVLLGVCSWEKLLSAIGSSVLGGLFEASSEQNDNLLVPLYMYCIWHLL